MKLQIAIDGACRNNGKPHCKSGAGVVVYNVEEDTACVIMDTDTNSTNQRGELKALRAALKYCSDLGPSDTVQIITDSEYILNTMNKGWYNGWRANGWLTKDNNPVKNRPLWQDIVGLYEDIECDISIYHIKGHVIPIGPVTAANIISSDPSALELYKHCLDKFYRLVDVKKDVIAKAQETSLKDNGFKLPMDTFATFVALNCTADIVANIAVETIR